MLKCTNFNLIISSYLWIFFVQGQLTCSPSLCEDGVAAVSLQ